MATDLFETRQAVVRAIIRGLHTAKKTFIEGNNAWEEYNLAFDATEVNHSQIDHCVATGLIFSDRMSEQQIVYSNYGPIWMGLWLDDSVKLDDEGHGNVLFPRWLAEVLQNECNLKISEEDIYDSSFEDHRHSKDGSHKSQFSK